MCSCGCDGAVALAEARMAASGGEPLSSHERVAPSSSRLPIVATGVERALTALRCLFPVWRSIS